MDELDATLIRLFAATPRIGVLEASRRLGVARGTVQARLDKLGKAGVISDAGIVRSSTVIALATQIPYRVLPLLDGEVSPG